MPLLVGNDQASKSLDFPKKKMPEIKITEHIATSDLDTKEAAIDLLIP